MASRLLEGAARILETIAGIFGSALATRGRRVALVVTPLGEAICEIFDRFLPRFRSARLGRTVKRVLRSRERRGFPLTRLLRALRIPPLLAGGLASGRGGFLECGLRFCERLVARHLSRPGGAARLALER